MDMDGQIAVSIIVPLYNRKKTIGRCLDSLMRQTLKNIEIVVVDDGSTDGGAEVVKECQKSDPRIRLLVQENRGLGAARNAGIRESCGEYLGFVDSDDYVEKHMYETMLEAARAENAEVAVCQEKNICFLPDGKEKFLGETGFPCGERTAYSSGQILDWFLNYTYLSLNSVCFKLVDRSVFTERNIWFPENYRYAEDLPTSAGIFSVVQKVVLVPESLYCYIREMGTLSTNYTVKKAVDVYRDMLDALRYLKKAGYTGNVDNFVLGMKFSSMRQFYGSKSVRERKEREGRILLTRWKKARKRVKPVFVGQEVPFFHKIKVLVAYLNQELPVCRIFQLFDRISFFKYMV